MICDETARFSPDRQAPIAEAEPAETFDDLTLLASQICSTPIAFMTLVDDNGHRVEACVGIDATAASHDSAFRAHTIQQDHLFVVAVTLDDDRFREHPLVVGEPRIRFYAGALLPFSLGCEFDVVIPADSASIRTVTEGVTEALRSKVGVFEREFAIELALQEALANAVRHGCGGMPRNPSPVPSPIGRPATCGLSCAIPVLGSTSGTCRIRSRVATR